MVNNHHLELEKLNPFFINDHSGKLEAEGSWADTLKIEFTNEDFSEKLASDHVVILGETLRIKVSWTVGDKSTNPIASKLNW